MKLARFSNNSEEKQAFQEKAEKLWKFLTNATGILDPASFQVGIAHWEVWLQNFPYFEILYHIFKEKLNNSESFSQMPRCS